MPRMTEEDWLATKTAPRRVRIKAGWFEAGREGDFMAVVVGRDGMVWGVVQWDGEDDPDCHKMFGLEDAGGHR